MNIQVYLKKRKPLLVLTSLVIPGVLSRYFFLVQSTLSEFDPWRHLILIDNIRQNTGFTLFADQTYIWYNALWYHLAALWGPGIYAGWLTSLLSLISAILFFYFLLRTEKSIAAALSGGFLVALYGPLITFTTGSYGAESFAFFLIVLSCLLATYKSSRMPAILAGCLFGIAIVARMNFVFNVFLILPLLADRGKKVIFLGMMTIVCAVTWWHNHNVISAHPYIFTWDGIATKSSDYNLVSTLIPQLHPAVVRATHDLYGRVMPIPFDFVSRGVAAWGNVVFMVVGTGCVLLTRRWWLILSILFPLLFFGLFDKTLSTNFYRHYLAVFPSLFIGISIISEQLRHYLSRKRGGRIRTLWPILIIIVLLSGLPYLRPKSMAPLKMVTTPPDVMTEVCYLVNSGFYHPESLVRRYPDKKFIGMPRNPEQFEDFIRYYPKYTNIVWHRQFSIQEDLLRYLIDSGRYQIVAASTNPMGIKYLLLQKISS